MTGLYVQRGDLESSEGEHHRRVRRPPRRAVHRWDIGMSLAAERDSTGAPPFEDETLFDVEFGE